MCSYVMNKLGWAKKLKNRLNRENRKKIIRKNRTVKKNRLKFWKNRPDRFGFGFISLKPKKSNRTETNQAKPKKTEPNRAKTNPNRKNRAKTEPNQKKTSQTGKNRAKPVWTGFCPKKPNWTETSRFEPVSVWFGFFYWVWLLFL